jgi:hypothetical protein
MTTQPGAAPDVEKIRQLLFHGGVVDGKRPDAALCLLMAEMVHQADTINWEHGGKQGPAPALVHLLRRVRVHGRILSDREWANVMAEHHPQESMSDDYLNDMIERDAEASQVRLLPDMEPQLKIAPRDVVKLRRDIAAWLDKTGPTFYQSAIENGRQNLFISQRKLAPAVALANAERDAMLAADLYYIDADMCQLLMAAHETMPDFAPMKADLPSETGFAFFALPISHHYNSPYAGEEDLSLMRPDGELVNITKLLGEQGSQICAVSWRPYTPGPSRAEYWPAGGCWMTFYSVPMTRILAQSGGPNAAIFAAAIEAMAPLAPENEMLVAWYDPALMGEESAVKLAERRGTAQWMRIVISAFQLARQSSLAQTDTERVPPRKLPNSKKRKTGQREQAGGDVRVVRLRAQIRAARDAEASEHDGDEKAGREYRHRWVVRGFWRNTWYGKSGVHRPQWIAPYLKGPAGAPLLKGEKVVLVSAPKN